MVELNDTILDINHSYTSQLYRLRFFKFMKP